jgi:hypothetical protein
VDLGSAVIEASPGRINFAWAATFVLAALTLFIVWRVVPGTEQLTRGKDGRASTSKFPATMWTLAVAFALFSLFFGFLAVQIGDLLNSAYLEQLKDPLGGSLDNLLGKGLDETYLLLLGLPLGTAVVSKGITSAKVDSGSIVKTPKTPSDPSTGSLQELVGDDDGNTDLGDFQYLLFNLLALGYFLVAFMSHPARGLPTLPDTLIALTGVAAATYIGKKGIYREPPVLLGVLPPAAKPGKKVRVYGQRLLTSADAGGAAGSVPPCAPVPDPQLGVMVTINGQAAELFGAPTDSMVIVRVPEMAAGPTMLKVLRPPGASSEELPFTVLAP